MTRRSSSISSHQRPVVAALLATAVLSGCIVGPDFQKTKTQALADGSSWRSRDASLHTVKGAGNEPAGCENCLGRRQPRGGQLSALTLIVK